MQLRRVAGASGGVLVLFHLRGSMGCGGQLVDLAIVSLQVTQLDVLQQMARLSMSMAVGPGMVHPV